MRRKMKQTLWFALALVLLICTPGLAAEEAGSLLAGYQGMLEQEPDMDVQIAFTGVFDFAEGADSMHTLSRSRFTHDPMAYYLEFAYESFSSGQEGKMTCMAYDGTYVMYAYDDNPQGNRLKREVTEEMLRETIVIPPVLIQLGKTALAHADAATLDADEATVRISLTPSEAAQFITDSELTLGGIGLQVDTEVPVDLLLRFDPETQEIAGISFDWPVLFTYNEAIQGGNVLLEVTFFELGVVSPVSMPEHAADVPFS